jgi:acyl carrier protein
MSGGTAVELICEKVRMAIADKGEPARDFGPETPLLGGELPLDSLDLASLIVELEHTCGIDPFQHGFVEFRTIRELADLFSKA